MRTFTLIIYFIVLITAVILGVLFAQDNAYFISIRFLGHDVPHAPIWVVTFISFAAGFILSMIIFSWNYISLYLSRKKYMDSYEQIKKILEDKMSDLKGSDKDTNS